MQNLTKEGLLMKVHDLQTEEKIANKLKGIKGFFHISKDIVGTFAKNIFEKTPIEFHSSSFETPTINQADSLILSLSNSFCR